MFSKIKRLISRKKKPVVFDDDEVNIDLEVAIAQEAIIAGERDHALLHLTRVLYICPNDEGAIRLLNNLIDSVPDPSDLLPGVQPETRAEAQMLSYILAKCARYDEAVDMLLEVVMGEPRSGTLQWLIDWMDDPAAVNAFPVKAVREFLGWVANNAQALWENEEAKANTVDLLPSLIARMRSTQEVDGDFLSMAAIALRRTVQAEAGLEVARAAYDAEPTYFSAIALGNCLRTTGDLDGAVAMFKVAIGFDPEDPAARLDIGDINYERGDFEAAICWYEEVLDREPKHDWALPSTYAARYRLTGDADWKRKLTELAGRSLDNQRASELDDAIDGVNFNRETED